MLSEQEKKYYSRQLLLPKFGIEGQEKLKQAKVAIVGGGGLGCPAIPYLVGVGVGKISIIDGDKVSETNLHRQTLFSVDDIGKFKSEVIRKKLSKHNPNVQIFSINEYLKPENSISILQGHDLVLDCTDNYPTRYLINDSCVLLNIPVIYGAIHRFEGQISVFNYKNGPTYRCVFTDYPSSSSQQNCSEAGVLGVLPGIIGLMQATEAIKIIVEIGEVLSGKIVIYNSLKMSFQTISIERKPEQLIRSFFVDGKLNPDLYPNNYCISDDFEIGIEEFDFSESNEYEWVDVREIGEKPLISPKLGIKSIPLSVFDCEMNRIDKTKPVILFCRSGVRSLMAAKILKQNGFENVRSLKSGIDEKIIKLWKQYLKSTLLTDP